MIGKKMQDALNDQVAYEFYSAHIYLSMWAYLESIDLPGFANWMRVQYQEEVFHAEKILDHLVERDGRAILVDWNAPKSEWPSVLAAVEEALAHEQSVTERFNKWMDLAIAEKDHASQIFLQWFVNEQVEEEASVKAIIQQLKLLGDSKAGRFQMDRELAQRVFTPPAPAAP
jgi:ferritin